MARIVLISALGFFLVVVRLYVRSIVSTVIVYDVIKGIVNCIIFAYFQTLSLKDGSLSRDYANTDWITSKIGRRLKSDGAQNRTAPKIWAAPRIRQRPKLDGALNRTAPKIGRRIKSDSA